MHRESFHIVIAAVEETRIMFDETSCLITIEQDSTYGDPSAVVIPRMHIKRFIRAIEACLKSGSSKAHGDELE